jgi:DNA-binding PadR family transcriptional regulator
MAKKIDKKKGDQLPRLSDTEFLIMSLLAEQSQRETYGLDLIEKSHGQLKKGTVYVLLGRLEQKGFIEGRFEIVGDAVPRKVYKPTGHGMKVFEAWKNFVNLASMRGAYA